MPIVFQPGTDLSVELDRLGGATTNLDLISAGAGATVTLNGDSPSVTRCGWTRWWSDTFSSISAFVGSSAGDTSLWPVEGGYSFEGFGSGNEADFSVDPNSITANLSPVRDR